MTIRKPEASRTRLGPESGKSLSRAQISQTRIGGRPGPSPNGTPNKHNRRTLGSSVSNSTYLSVSPSALSVGNTSPNRSPVGETAGNAEEENAKGKLWRKIFTIYFIFYCVICFLFILATAVVWGIVATSKLKYFITPPNTIPFFHVETGTTWMVCKFLLGSVLHMVLAWSGVCILSGGKCSQDLIAKSLDKFKIFLWLGVIAVVGEVLMLDATFDYIITSPIVQNGDFMQTILPPASTIGNCIKSDAVRDDPDINPGMRFLRINLNWFVEVMCRKQKEKKIEVARWESYFQNSQVGGGNVSVPCKMHLNELEEGAREDCANAMYLYHSIFSWLILSFLGIFFVFALFWLNGKLSIKLAPVPRFSFAGMNPFEARDLEYLRAMAEKVRHMGSPAMSKKRVLERSPSPRHIDITVEPA